MVSTGRSPLSLYPQLASTAASPAHASRGTPAHLTALAQGGALQEPPPGLLRGEGSQQRTLTTIRRRRLRRCHLRPLLPVPPGASERADIRPICLADARPPQSGTPQGVAAACLQPTPASPALPPAEQQPEAVFADIARVTKPGAVVCMSFSNRMFPSKATYAWRQRSEGERTHLVADYFR